MKIKSKSAKPIVKSSAKSTKSAPVAKSTAKPAAKAEKKPVAKSATGLGRGNVFNVITKMHRNPMAWFGGTTNRAMVERVASDTKHNWKVSAKAKAGYIIIHGMAGTKNRLFAMKAKIDGAFASVVENVCLGRKTFEDATKTEAVCHIPWVKEQYGPANVHVVHSEAEAKKVIAQHKNASLCNWCGGELNLA